ncbi:MAG: 50S ribosomal protein L29 [Planctomycetota bacterium]|jgi:large subunit ribosomal protein L29
MKAQHYREMSPDEIESKLEELQRHLFDLRSQAVTEKLENSKAIINVKRDIARIKTILRENSEKLTVANAKSTEKRK